MEDAHSRLKEARTSAGFSTAAEAARALGMATSTYAAYENGQNGLSRVATKLARKFNVQVDWLLDGRGEMRPRRAAQQNIPMMGFVAAGSAVLPMNAEAEAALAPSVTLPEPGHIAALLIKGDSMFPRFMDGEIILYDPTPRPPASMVGHYAVVQTLDGRVMIKKLLASIKPDHWRLWSHNVSEEDTKLLTTHRVVGVLI